MNILPTLLIVGLLVAFILMGMKSKGVNLSSGSGGTTWKKTRDFFTLDRIVIGSFIIIALGWMFWPESFEDQYLARPTLGTGMVSFRIPQLPEEYENKIVFVENLGAKSRDGSTPTILFKGVLTANSSKIAGWGGAAQRTLLGAKHAPKRIVWRGQKVGNGLTTGGDFSGIGAGAELEFSRRDCTHEVRIMGSQLEVSGNLRYKLVKKKK